MIGREITTTFDPAAPPLQGERVEVDTEIETTKTTDHHLMGVEVGVEVEAHGETDHLTMGGRQAEK